MGWSSPLWGVKEAIQATTQYNSTPYNLRGLKTQSTQVDFAALAL